jgi:hypothetical protein
MNAPIATFFSKPFFRVSKSPPWLASTVNAPVPSSRWKRAPFFSVSTVLLPLVVFSPSWVCSCPLPDELHLVIEAGGLGAGREQRVRHHHHALGGHHPLRIRGGGIAGQLSGLPEGGREDALAFEMIEQAKADNRQTNDEQECAHEPTSEG